MTFTAMYWLYFDLKTIKDPHRKIEFIWDKNPNLMIFEIIRSQLNYV